jgi:polysaccharide export outer membrane protein
MRSRSVIKKAGLITIFIFGLSAALFAQASAVKKDEGPAVTRDVKTVAVETPTPTDPKADAKPDTPEAEAIVPFYDNFLKEYRLGPNDVISVEVFGQCPDYCRSAINVPPTARISYPLVREGIMVGGKTVEQVAAEITKKLDEYIIDPKVTVTLERAMSARYSVLGKVSSPGVRVLDRKISVYEAVVESGGVAKDGDAKKVIVYSYNGTGKITSKLINLAEIQRGQAEMVFLKPGDQVFVSGKGFSLDKVFEIISKVSMARFLVGTPF